MTDRSLRRLRMTRDLPARPAGFMGLDAAPPLLAGDVVLAYPGRAQVADSEVAVCLEPGGPWFPVPKAAVEEIGPGHDGDTDAPEPGGRTR